MLTKTQKLTLFSFGQCHKQLCKKYQPLEVPVSKIVFIEALLGLGVSKSERAVYKNLEALERNKLIIYKQKELGFTSNGYKLFQKLDKEIEAFIRYKSLWNSDFKLKRKLQAHLK